MVLTCVQEEVVLQVGDLAEPPVANRASVRPRPVVDVHVGLEVARGGERLLAQLALVGLLLKLVNVLPKKGLNSRIHIAIFLKERCKTFVSRHQDFIAKSSFLWTCPLICQTKTAYRL